MPTLCELMYRLKQPQMTDRELRIHITNDPTYGENGMTIHLRDGGPAWIIDPGLPPQAEQILTYVKAHALDVKAIMLTHAHADHIAGIDAVREALGPVPVYLAREEWTALSDPMDNLSGRVGPGFATAVDDPKDLPAGTTLDLDGVEWKVLDTSGHSPGGRTFFAPDLGVAIAGDALFAGSVGRVDFPHSDGKRLMANIHANLMTLPDETRVLSGHGPETTIGQEKTSNPFILYGL